ncbi:MAG: NAD(P)H-dependent oxidoreductase, partial [Hylemonella sp.]
MNSRRILVLQGHPDASAPHLCHALAAAYAEGARSAGHEVHIVEIATLDFPLLRSQHEWEHTALPAGLQSAQDEIAWAQHLLIVFPLWLGDMPALRGAPCRVCSARGVVLRDETQGAKPKASLDGLPGFATQRIA